ncbi:MAG: hypothetical protein HZA49_10110 [Planctomycetes bacterium]|nr:hypothetical protein [Planctomycetota bacterium]
MERIENKFLIAGIISLLIVLTSCATPYEAARKSFYKANRSYLKQEPEDALIRYCQSLGRLETGADKNLSSRMLKAAIYHRLYSIDAKNIYLNSGDRTKEKYASFSKLLSTSDNAGFLNSAFNEVVSMEKELKNIDAKTIDPFLLIHRDLIVADKLSSSLDLQNKTITPTSYTPMQDFIKAISSYGYEEVIKTFYLDAWASALVRYQKTSQDEEAAQKTNEVLYTLSLSRLKHIYYSLRNTTASVKIPEFQSINSHYHEVITKMEKISPGPNLSSFSVSSPEQAMADLLGEIANNNYFILDPEFHLAEARNRMNLSIEMIITGKADKAESHLLNALMSIVCAKEFSINPSPANARLIDTILNDIYLNLSRIPGSGK